MRLPHECEGLRVRRMTVWWTFCRPFMGRPGPRQLLRNAWLDLTTIVPATAYHRRSYAERYSRFITISQKRQKISFFITIVPQKFTGVHQGRSWAAPVHISIWSKGS